MRVLDKPADGEAVFLDEMNATFYCGGVSKNYFGGFTWLLIWGGGTRAEGNEAWTTNEVKCRSNQLLALVPLDVRCEDLH